MLSYFTIYGSLVAGSQWGIGASVVDDAGGTSAEMESEMLNKRGNDVIATIITKEHKKQQLSKKYSWEDYRQY